MYADRSAGGRDDDMVNTPGSLLKITSRLITPRVTVAGRSGVIAAARPWPEEN